MVKEENHSFVFKKSDTPIEIQGSLLVRNIVMNFFGLSLPLVIGILTIPVIIRWLGDARFGILSLAWVVVGYFSIFDLGLGRATTKFIAEALGKGEVYDIPKFFWTTVIFQGVLGFIGAVSLFIITPVLVERIIKIPFSLINEARLTFYILSLSIPIVLISASFRGALEAGQRFDLVNAVKIPSNLSNYIFPVMGIILGFSLPGIMALLVFSRACAFFAWIMLSLKVFPYLNNKISIHKGSIKPLLSFGGWVAISSVIGPVLVYFDRFLIGAILTVEAVAYYSAPYEVIMRLGIIPGSLLMTLFPAFSALRGERDNEKISVLFSRSTKYLFLTVGFIVVLLILFAKSFLGAWLGEKFLENSTYVFQILALGFLMNTLANVPFGFLQGIGRADVTAKFHLAETVFSIPLTWILIKFWGINGAALAWTVRAGVDMILLFWASRKIGNIGISSLSANGFFRGVIALLVYIFFGYLATAFNCEIIGLIPFTIGFFFFTWFFAFNQDERSWLWDKFRIFFKGKMAI